MDKFDFQSSSLTTLRCASLDTSTSVLKSTSSTLCRLSPASLKSSKRTVTSRPLFYDLHTAYLFTSKDIKTIIVPQTLFGLFNAYAATHDASAVLSRTPFVLAWVFLNLLPFCIDNQRQPGSMAEDSVNRPSRPLPAKRLTAEAAFTWVLVLYTAAFVLSLFVGGTSMCIALVAIGWLYNDCQMSEQGLVGRNVLTALGYAAFGVGALMVAMPTMALDNGLGAKTWVWVAILVAVIGTTGHVTDMADLEGDRQRGRKTAPIVWGEEVAKWTICVPVGVWSVLCPWFWEARFLGLLLPVLTGGKIISRLLTEETAAHKNTNRIWNLWVVVLYMLPLFAGRS